MIGITLLLNQVPIAMCESYQVGNYCRPHIYLRPYHRHLSSRIVSIALECSGQANGYMSKFWGLFLIPLIMTGFVALFVVLPRIDPYKKNYEKFRDYYEGFILLFVLFMLAIQVQIILWSIGYRISPNLTFPVLIGILFIYIGFLLRHAEQNWFVGIRTPWTLSSKTVWKKTHRPRGEIIHYRWCYFLCRYISGAYTFWFILVPVLAVAVIPWHIPIIEFRKEMKSQEKES